MWDILIFIMNNRDFIMAILCFIIALCVAGVLIYEIKELKKIDDDENV